MLRFFGLSGTRRAPTHTVTEPRRFRPTLETLEAREVPSAAPMAAPALGPALVTPAAPVQQAASLLPINVNSVNLTGVANNALQLVANATTPNGTALQIPLALSTGTGIDPATGSTIPVVNLHVGAIHLNVLGLKVDTSEICLQINAQSGPGQLLGNLVTDVANLLNNGGTPTTSQLTNLTGQVTNLVNGALSTLGTPTSATAQGASVSSPDPTTRILHLSLGPVNANVLGLQVLLNNCANPAGPVTVDVSAQTGPGNLLGNLLGGLSHLLDSNANTTALVNKLDNIAGEITSIL